MKNTHVYLSTENKVCSNSTNGVTEYRGASIDRPLAMILTVSLLPLIIFNTLFSFVCRNNVFSIRYCTDALGRPVMFRKFSAGAIKNSAILFDIIKGDIGFCGVSSSHSLSKEMQQSMNNQLAIKPGLFSLYDLHLKTGLTVTSEDLLFQQQIKGAFSDYISLLIKSTLCVAMYGSNTKTLKESESLSLFGLEIKNTTMQQAVSWITQENRKVGNTKIGFFVNVNSVNLSINHQDFYQRLNKADALFVDGSGMRLAAAKAGYRLSGNNNGTDMLPHLCERAVKEQQSIYLLGAKPTIAEKAAENLKAQFSGLFIAGTQDGYSNLTDDEIVANINNSHCDILLVAMGSPIQEKWLIENRDKLQCNTALAVGGLFDFYSGAISRSPLWLRELGMEWVWRLLQEPFNKFNRYVIGTPLFLYRTFFLNLVNTGEK